MWHVGYPALAGWHGRHGWHGSHLPPCHLSVISHPHTAQLQGTAVCQLRQNNFDVISMLCPPVAFPTSYLVRTLAYMGHTCCSCGVRLVRVHWYRYSCTLVATVVRYEVVGCTE
jgi:hypothetical protein